MLMWEWDKTLTDYEVNEGEDWTHSRHTGINADRFRGMEMLVTVPILGAIAWLVIVIAVRLVMRVIA